jgi:5-methyltetrahydropteroyltriglutamate--homocysteine methyltransferase
MPDPASEETRGHGNLWDRVMLKTTRDMMLPTAITGSYPRPLWFDRSLDGRSFKAALGDSLFREQYLDAVAAIINAQEAAGLDIVTDGDSRFDLVVGGKSWFFYPIERLGGIHGHRSTSQGWMARHDIRPGRILWEVQEAYQPAIVKEKLSRGPLEYAALWQIAQRLSDRPVKFGAICAPALASMLWNEYYADDKEMILDLCDIMNAELRELAAAGCPLIQVEEPRHHGLTTRPDCSEADLEFQTQAFNRQLKGVDAEIWVHTCWGNPNQQRVYWEVPSYERALPYLLQLDADVVTFECASSDGKDLPLFARYKTEKKIGIGVVNHCITTVEPPEYVAGLIRKALEYIPPERLVITTDCGFGREGLSRRIAYYKCVSLVEGANIVRRELGLPEAHIRAADPKLYFATAGGAS